MHKLVKCKNANHQFAHLHAFWFVRLSKSTGFPFEWCELSLTFPNAGGINESQGFTFAQFKAKNVKFKGANVKYKSKGGE